MIIPNLFIAGVPKGGTTALAALLSQHPEIFIPFKKEPRYFLYQGNKPSSKDLANKNVIWDFDDYRNLYSRSKHNIRVDGSPGYLSSESAIRSIHKFNPKAKFIILLRDPVERSYSHFIFAQKKGFEPMNTPFSDIFINDVIKLPNGFIRKRPYIEIGFYDQQLNILFEHFSKDQILITTSERFLNNQLDILKDIQSFLKIDQYNFNLEIGEKAKSGIPTNKLISTTLGAVKKFRRIVPRSMRLKVVKDIIENVSNRNLRKPALNDNDRNRMIEIYKTSVFNLRQNYEIDTSLWKNFS